MMQGTAQLQDYETTPLTVTLTAPVRDWRELLAAMKDVQRWPASDFKNAVFDAVNKTMTRIESVHPIGAA